MQSYPINELERLTGIKAHTIRIWEKRYKLITPNRTATNRRSYSDSQFRKLLNVATLVSQGHKISHVATLTDEQIEQSILNTQLPSGDSICQGYVNDLIKYMLAFEEAGFEKIYSAALTRLGLYNAIIQVIYPFLRKTGIMWSVNETAPAQEHFASAIIRRKLISAIDGLPHAAASNKKILLFLPEGEWHEIGLLLADYLLRLRGCYTIYLGQNVPVDNVATVAELVNATHLLLFYTTTLSNEKMEKQLNAYAAAANKARVLVGGNKSLLLNHKTGITNVTYLTEPNVLLNEIDNI